MAFDTSLFPNVKGFEIIKNAGSGAWGSVYKAKKLAGEKIVDGEVALKFLDPTLIAQDQMQYRGLELGDILLNEAGRVGKTTNVVPRTVHTHGDVPFIEMPFYETFFDELIQDEKEVPRVSIEAGNLSLEQMLLYSRDLANGTYEVHSQLGRAHGDLKPNNVAVEEVDDKKRLLITDLGSSVGLDSIYGKSNPRDNIGFILGRAPELFSEGNHPTVESDVWALGSMMYRMVTGEYIFEKELRPLADQDAQNGTSLVKEYVLENKDNFQKIIDKKLKNVDNWKLRCLLNSSLKINTEERLDSAKQMRDTLEGLILESHKEPWWKQAFIPSVIGIPIAVLALATSLFHKPAPDYTLPVPVDEVQLTFNEETEIGLSRRSYSINGLLTGELKPAYRFGYGGTAIEVLERLTADETVYDSSIEKAVWRRDGTNTLAHFLTSYYLGRTEFFNAMGPHGTSFLNLPKHFRDRCEENIDRVIHEKSTDLSNLTAGRGIWTDREEWIRENYGRPGNTYCSWGPMRSTGPNEQGVQVATGFEENPDVFLSTMIDLLEEGHARAYRDHKGTSIEDLLAYTLLGPEVVDRAKEITGSQDFAVYSNAVVRDKSAGIGGKLISYDDRYLVGFWSEAFLLRSGQITFDYDQGAFYNTRSGEHIDNNPYDDEGKFFVDRSRRVNSN